MFIRKENRKVICEHLYREGVMWAKKNFFLPRHPEVGVPNLEVIKLMKSFKSKEYVIEQFNWQTYYWRLTDEGQKYIQRFLNLPSNVEPSTWVPQPEEQPPQSQRRDFGDRDQGGRFGGGRGGGFRQEGGGGGFFRGSGRGFSDRRGRGRGRYGDDTNRFADSGDNEFPRRDFRGGRGRGGFREDRGGFGQDRGGFGQDRGGFGQDRGGGFRGGFRQDRGGFRQDRGGGFRGGFRQDRGGYRSERFTNRGFSRGRGGGQSENTNNANSNNQQ